MMAAATTMIEALSDFIGNPGGEASFQMAPAVGFEPTTNRLTADRSTTELRWIVCGGICCSLNNARQASVSRIVIRQHLISASRFSAARRPVRIVATNVSAAGNWLR